MHECAQANRTNIRSTDHVESILVVFARAFARLFFNYGGPHPNLDLFFLRQVLSSPDRSSSHREREAGSLEGRVSPARAQSADAERIRRSSIGNSIICAIIISVGMKYSCKCQLYSHIQLYGARIDITYVDL